MNQDSIVVRSRGFSSALETNSILQKTYALLAATLLFSGLTAAYAMTTNALPLNPFIVLVGYFGLLILTNVLRNSAWGLVSIFALTGFMGYTLGPIINFYLHNIVNGHQVVFMALGGTGGIFAVLSAYALITKKDFSFMSGFIMTGLVVAFLGGIASIFMHMPALSLAVSAAFILLSSGIILLQTGAIINGGETSYISATITLYVSLYNIFLSLLQLLGAFSNRD